MQGRQRLSCDREKSSVMLLPSTSSSELGGTCVGEQLEDLWMSLMSQLELQPFMKVVMILRPTRLQLLSKHHNMPEH